MTVSENLWHQTSFSGKVTLAVLGMVIIMALGAPWICRHSPYESSGPPLAVPNEQHFCGTDDLSVDLLSQILCGLRNSLLVGPGSALLAGLTGIVIGIWPVTIVVSSIDTACV